SPHRDRVGVVAVVDQDAAARKGKLLPAPGREDDLARALPDLRERQAERAVRRERDERVVDVVLRGEVELDLDVVVAELDLEAGRPRAGREPDEAHIATGSDAHYFHTVERQERLQ